MDSKINTALAFFISACGYIIIAYQSTQYFAEYQYQINGYPTSA